MVSFNIKYLDTKLNSLRDILNYMRDNYQFSFLPNFGKVFVFLNIIPATSCYAERPFFVLRKLKPYLRRAMDQDCLGHLALLRIERAYSNRVNTEKVIDEFESRKGSFKFFLNQFLFI